MGHGQIKERGKELTIIEPPLPLTACAPIITLPLSNSKGELHSHFTGKETETQGKITT